VSDWVYPDYRGGSIVNLMSSILTVYDTKPGIYPPLRDIETKELQSARNLVLLVIDGLGYDYLYRQGAGSTLYRHLQQRITSVAPPTTATAISTFLTGLAPQQLEKAADPLEVVGVAEHVRPAGIDHRVDDDQDPGTVNGAAVRPIDERGIEDRTARGLPRAPAARLRTGYRDRVEPVGEAEVQVGSNRVALQLSAQPDAAPAEFAGLRVRGSGNRGNDEEDNG